MYIIVDNLDYSGNSLLVALNEVGATYEKLQMVKLFVMNRMILKCKLKDVCDKLQIHITLTSIHKDSSCRAEPFW